LWIALLTGNLDAVEMLVEHAADSANLPLPGNVNRNTLVHRAVAFLPDYLLSLVLPSLNVKGTVQQHLNAQQLFPLHFAILLGKTKAASALALSMPVALEADAFGNTPLHLAVTGRAVDWVVTFAKFDAEARNSLFFTPLMTCCAVGSRHAISALLAHGCDPVAVNEATRRAALAHLELRALSKIVLPFEHEARPTGVFVLGNVAAKDAATPTSVTSSPLTLRKNKLLGAPASTESPAASPSTGRKIFRLGSGSMKTKNPRALLGTLKF
jgi:ankyrin repeat protein